jgi:hypothetical protein
MGQFASEYFLGEEPLRGEVRFPCAVVAEVQLEQLAQTLQWSSIGNHPALLKGGISPEVHALNPL